MNETSDLQFGHVATPPSATVAHTSSLPDTGKVSVYDVTELFSAEHFVACCRSLTPSWDALCVCGFAGADQLTSVGWALGDFCWNIFHCYCNWIRQLLSIKVGRRNLFQANFSLDNWPKLLGQVLHVQIQFLVSFFLDTLYNFGQAQKLIMP